MKGPEMFTLEFIRNHDLGEIQIRKIESIQNTEYQMEIKDLNTEEFKNILKKRIPKGFEWILNYIEFKPIRKISGNFNRRFGIFPVFKIKPRFCLLDFKDYGEFTLHPYHLNLAVSKTGHFVNMGTMKEIGSEIIRTINLAYEAVKVPRSYLSSATSRTKHRLTAEAWVKNDDYFINYIVDHIDRNKFNNRVENLRWVSQAVNIGRHNSSSNEDNRYMLMDVEIGKIYEFLSLRKIADFLRVDVRNIEARTLPTIIKIKTKEGDKYYIIEDKENFTNWSLLKKAVIGKYRYKVIYPNNSIKYFVTIEDVVRSFKIPRKVLGSDRYEDAKNYLANIDVKLVRLVENDYRNPNNKKYKIEAMDLDTGEVIVADSTRLMAEKLGLKSKSHIIFRLNGNKREGLPLVIGNKKYLIRKSTEPWPEIREKKNESRNIYDNVTGRTFSSLREAARELHVNRATIASDLKGPMLRFKYV